MDILYNRVNQDVRRVNGTLNTAGAFVPFTGAAAGTTVTREHDSGWTGRLRVERTF